MNIGIFGDSFALDGWTYQTPWWKYLIRHGHTVNSYANASTSILYSAKLIQEHASKYDFIIWCVTNTNRLTVPIDEDPGILNSIQIIDFVDPHIKGNLENTNIKIKLIKDWFKYIQEPDELFLVGAGVVTYMLSIYKNLMVIPCFIDPVGTKFNLSEVSNNELKHYFSDKETPFTLYKNYDEFRCCHLSIENNKILGNLIGGNLSHGIFQPSYENFVTAPNKPRDFYYKLKHEK